jgi:hypothetical protein
MHVQEGEWGDMDWIDLAQDSEIRRVIWNGVMKLWLMKNVGDFLTS